LIVKVSILLPSTICQLLPDVFVSVAAELKPSNLMLSPAALPLPVKSPMTSPLAWPALRMKVSLPAPPVRLSAPAPPSSRLAPLLPAMTLARALPVPDRFSVPSSVRPPGWRP